MSFIMRPYRYAAAGGAVLAFDALNYDPLTYEMKGVLTGTGDLTVTCSSTHYAPDKDGVYQQFAANTPVWSGGRVTLIGGAGSVVDKVYGDDGAGTPLPEAPYLQFYPSATNERHNSGVVGTETNTLTVGKWAVKCFANGTDTASCIVAAGTATGTGFATVTQGDTIELDITVEGTVTTENTGDILCTNLTNTTKAQAQGLGPIFTAGATGSTEAIKYEFALANHSEDSGAYYIEVETSELSGDWTYTIRNCVIGTGQTTQWGPMAIINRSNIRSYDGSNWGNGHLVPTGGSAFKFGSVYHAADALQSIRDGVNAFTEQPYDGTYIAGAPTGIRCGMTQSAVDGIAIKFRNLQRYDITSYQQGKDLIDDLM